MWANTPNTDLISSTHLTSYLTSKLCPYDLAMIKLRRVASACPNTKWSILSTPRYVTEYFVVVR